MRSKFLAFVWFAGFALSFAGCASNKLVIDSEPSGSAIFINDQPMGKTPLTIDYKKLPYEDNFELRIEKEGYGSTLAIVTGPKQASLGEHVHVKIQKAPDETAILNREMERIMESHRLALAHRFTEATRIADQIILDHPRLLAPQLLRASILFLSKNFAGAEDQYRKILELDPANTEATKMLRYLAGSHLVPARAISGGAAP